MKTMTDSFVDPLRQADDLVLSTRCIERGIEHMRHVYIVWPTVTLENYLWPKLRLIPNMFSLGPMVDKKSLEHLYDAQKMFLLVDDVGMIGLDFKPLDEIGVHMTFWDRRLRGRETLGYFVALWIMRSFETKRLITTIPADARATLAYAKRVGFRVNRWYEASYLNKNGELEDMVELVFDAISTVDKGV